MNSKQTWEDLANILRLYFWQILWRRGKPTFPKLVGFPWILQKWCVLIFAPSKSHSVTCQIFQSFLAPLIHEETAHCNKDDTIRWKRRLIQLHLQEFWFQFCPLQKWQLLWNFCHIWRMMKGAVGNWCNWCLANILKHLHNLVSPAQPCITYSVPCIIYRCIQLKNVTGKTSQ